jgi:hypothetical protein
MPTPAAETTVRSQRMAVSAPVVVLAGALIR